MGQNTFSTEPIMDKYWARCLIIKDTAYQMLISEEDFVIPGYVEEAIEWLNE